MSDSLERPDRRLALTLLAGAALLGGVVLVVGADAALLRDAAGIRESHESVDGVVRVLNRLETPALVAAGAMVPLVIIGGAIALMVGSRRGLQYIGLTVGAMLLLASVSGISA